MATLPLAALLALITSAHGATLRVGPTQAYTTVGAAVAAASSGDTVLIDPGAYAESMAVTGKTLTLEADQGRGTVTLLSTGGDDGFLLLAPART